MRLSYPNRHRRAAPHQYIRWIREGDVLLDTREPDLLPPVRIQLDSKGNLRVANVRNADTGEYVCEVMTPHGLATQVHAIEVQCESRSLMADGGVGELHYINIPVHNYLFAQPLRAFCPCRVAPSN